MHAYLALLLTLPLAAPAQDVGSRLGIAPPLEIPPPDPDTIGEFILVEGSAEMRVDPTEARVVLAITSEGADPAACRQSNAQRLDALRAALQGAGVAADGVFVDFIALTPVYEWRVEKQQEQNVGVERRVAFRLQENAHVLVKDLALVPAVRAAAFDAGVTDLVAFDYGCDHLDLVKENALKSALENAKRKADLLLGATFGDARPPLLNIRERVDVQPPAALYRRTLDQIRCRTGCARIAAPTGGAFDDLLPRLRRARRSARRRVADVPQISVVGRVPTISPKPEKAPAPAVKEGR
jgi:uncharacterized protein YggE